MDPSLLPKSADIPTYGYLQAAAFGGGEAAAPLPVGLLTPAGEADCLVLTAGLNGCNGCAYGYGTRLILLGETQHSYLVRTPTGECGFLNKADITLTGQTAAQEGYAALAYGTATLARACGYRQRPYTRSGEMGQWNEGEQITLLSDLGAWWCVLRDADSTAFLPADALAGLPGDAPAYEGVYNAFRDEPFAFTWRLTPPLFHTDTDAWLLLRDEQALLLSHRVYRDGAWTESSRPGALFGGAVRLLGDFGGNGEQMIRRTVVTTASRYRACVRPRRGGLAFVLRASYGVRTGRFVRRDPALRPVVRPGRRWPDADGSRANAVPAAFRSVRNAADAVGRGRAAHAVPERYEGAGLAGKPFRPACAGRPACAPRSQNPGSGRGESKSS
jgi:hypothetical protein